MNGIILIDKATGPTSHDTVARLRRILKERRVGHAGTLDPIASGLLVVFIGRATRAAEFVENDEKEYVAGLRLGIDTDTSDITGKIRRAAEANVSKEDIKSALECFRGDIEQIPPMYSAIKQNGQRLYKLARKGIEVERKPRPATITALEVIGESGGDILLGVKCSKGVYIRSLCRDIGEKLGCFGVMSSLRRVSSGRFSVDNAVSEDEAERMAHEGRIEDRILPTDSLFDKHPSFSVDPGQEKKCRAGAPFEADAPDGPVRVYSGRGQEFLMLGNAADGVIHTVKSFFEV